VIETPEKGLEVIAGPPPALRPLTAIGTLDTPQRIDLGVTYRLALGEGEEAWLALSTPLSDAAIVLDMRSAAGERTNLQSSLSLLDTDGVIVARSVIGFNVIDHGYREIGLVSFGRVAAPARLKISNGGNPNLFWLTVFNSVRVPFVPLFGQVTPTLMQAGETWSGSIDPGVDLYFRTTLKKAAYKVYVDLTNVPRDRTNIQAHLTIMDALGAGPQTVLAFNEIDYAFRKTAQLRVPSDGPRILRLQNRNTPATYAIRIVPEG
jgi:hypothetical protein